MPKIEKPDELQSIANLIRFFAYAGRSPSVMKITQNSLAVNLTESLASLLYQTLSLAKSLPFTDTSMKMDTLSVIGLLEKWRLRTKWSKIAECP